MVIHSSILGWRNPWIEEPGRLWSIGSQRVGHNCSDLACTHTHHKNVLCFFINVPGVKTQDGRFCLLGREGQKLK